MRCLNCHQEIRGEAADVKIYGMFDCHLFHRYEGATVDDVIASWRKHIAAPIPATFKDGTSVDDLGPTDLCPAIVLDADGTELRRVGTMVHVRGREPDAGLLREYRAALLADPDVPRLLALRHNDQIQRAP